MTQKQVANLIHRFETSKKGEREKTLKLKVNECLELIAHYEQANKTLANSLLLYRKMQKGDKLELISEYIQEEEGPLVKILAELHKGRNVENYNIVALENICTRLWDVNKLWLLIDREKKRDEQSTLASKNNTRVVEKKVSIKKTQPGAVEETIYGKHQLESLDLFKRNRNLNSNIYPDRSNSKNKTLKKSNETKHTK